MRNTWLIGAFVILGCVLCRAAVADELFKYNYVEVGYLKATAETSGFSPKTDGSGYGIFGSYAVHELVALGVGYSKVKASFNGSYSGIPCSFNSSGNGLAVGVTLHKMVSDGTELGFDLSRHHLNSDATSITIAGTPSTQPASTDNYNSFGIGARTAITSAFRLFASIGRSTGGNSDASTDYSIGAEYELGKKFSLGADYGLSNSSSGSLTTHTRGLGISGRYYY